MAAARTHRRTAFTLIELIVAATIMSILATALGSAILIASHSIPNGSSGFELALESGGALDELAGDLTYATYIWDLAEDGITFSLPDRGISGYGEELVWYEWSGNPGDSLDRWYNFNGPIAVVSNVQDFKLTYTPKEGDAGEAVTGVTIELTVGVDPQQTFHATVQTLNKPEANQSW